MAYAVIWLHNAPENGSVRKLMSLPESIQAENDAEAKREGLAILNELSPEQRSAMKPLAVVEVTDQMLEDFQGCRIVTLPVHDELDADAELTFVDISEIEHWVAHSWWLR